MAANKQELHGKLKKELSDYSASDAYKNDRGSPKHMAITAAVMRGYFEASLEITYGWSAALPNPPNTPDPVTSFKSSVKFPEWDLDAPQTLEGLAAKIQAAVMAGAITHEAGFLLPPGAFLLKGPLVLPKHDKAEECLMECIVAPVCDWIATLANPAPLAGSRAGYIGATAGMAIR